MTTPKDTWISVKDAMPEPSFKRLLLYIESLDYSELWVYVNDHFGNKFFSRGSSMRDEIKGVTHWMLLSKPTNK